MIKVLMFGWEFPPHISGGLGTACFGLTQSLIQEEVSLTFVVPKLHGGENVDEMRLVGADNVKLPVAGALPQKIRRSVVESITSLRQEEETHCVVNTTKTIEWIEVEAKLDPYQLSSSKHTYGIENWNYSIDQQTHLKEVPYIEEVVREFDEEILPDGVTFPFKGGYGNQLMEEVNQYSKVGAKLGKEIDHDVIHAHDWMTFGAGIEAKKLSGKPLVIHVHATEFDRSGYAGGPVYELEKQGMEAADRIVAVSEWTKNILISKYNVPSDKVVVVHNGIIAETPKEVTSFTMPPVGSNVVTFLGRITFQKGPAYFVEAARRVLEKIPDAHFIIAGSGDLLPQTIDRVAQLRLSEHFHFTGFLNKDLINRIWSISDVYVMPSVSEPFGITPLEAIQAGVPVIVSKQSGVSEVMNHALKVDFWDTESLANAICSVLRYKSLSSMLKSKGEQEVRKLSWNKAATKLKSLYEELVPTLC